jgi:ornithine--oxo-acid transaminase
VSAVLADDEIMLTIKPGEHGSTFGGSPLASVVAVESIKVLIDEGMAENSEKMGAILRQGLNDMKSPFIDIVRGKGLMNAIVIKHKDPDAAWFLCESFMHNGLLAKPTHGDKIRLSPPLVIDEKKMRHALEIIEKSLHTLNNL